MSVEAGTLFHHGMLSDDCVSDRLRKLTGIHLPPQKQPKADAEAWVFACMDASLHIAEAHVACALFVTSVIDWNPLF